MIDMKTYHKLKIGREVIVIIAGMLMVSLLLAPIVLAASQTWYWTDVASGSDYVIQKGREIIPLEVKAGRGGHMKSMKIFIEEHLSPYGIKISLENFSLRGNIHIYPLYAIGNILQESSL